MQNAANSRYEYDTMTETQMQYTSTRNVLPWNQRITSHTSYTDSHTYDSLFGRLKEREN